MSPRETTAIKTNATAAETPTARTNLFAVLGLIFSIGGFLLGFPSAIAGIVIGHIALHNIAKSGEQGRGMAISALVVGYAQIALTCLVLFVGLLITLLFGWAWWQHGAGPYFTDNV